MERSQVVIFSCITRADLCKKGPDFIISTEFQNVCLVFFDQQFCAIHGVSAPKMTCVYGPYKETILINESQSLAANKMYNDGEKLLMKKSRQPMMFLASFLCHKAFGNKPKNTLFASYFFMFESNFC